MKVEIKNIDQLISFIETAPTLSDNDVIKLVNKTTRLIIPFHQSKEQTIKELKSHFKLFGSSPTEDRPLFLCSRKKEFSIKDLYFFS